LADKNTEREELIYRVDKIAKREEKLTMIFIGIVPDHY
jgi:hypothetical protein